MTEAMSIVYLQVGSPEFNELIKTVRDQTRETTIEELRKSQQDDFISAAEVKKILACGDRRLYTLRIECRIKSFRTGREYRYEKKSVLAWRDKESKS